MTVTLSLIAGQVGVQLPDSSGTARDYLVRLQPLQPDEWAICLERIDTGAGHNVRCDITGTWHCDCRDWVFRGRHNRGRPANEPCKHLRAAMELRPLFDAIREQFAPFVQEPT